MVEGLGLFLVLAIVHNSAAINILNFSCTYIHLSVGNIPRNEIMTLSFRLVLSKRNLIQVKSHV